MAVGAGTPTHLAPEVIAGTVRPGQAHLADLYALGVVLFELFAGCLPFESPSVVGLMASHLGQRAPSLLAFRPDAPPALAALLAELLAKEPEDRPASAALVAWQLRRIRASIRSTAAASPFSVLIIDDDPIVMQLMQRCASSALPSSRVEVAADAQKALRLLRRSPPDLILLDLNLPGMSGVELCMYLRGSGLAATSTIVCVSVAVSPGDERLLRLLGVSRTLHKTDRFFADLRSLLVDLERRGGPSR
jgi:serine/threonine-protein kinase